MFKKLKKRLLTINMFSITLLMIIAFCSIFFLTYSRTNMEIDNALNRLEGFKPNGEKPPNIFEDVTLQTPEEEKLLPEREVSFVINLDHDNTILSAHSFFDADDSFYEEALSLVKNNKKNYIVLEDDKWAYKMVTRKDFQQIFFLEVTTQLNSVTRLAYTFLIVFLVMFILNYIFSNYMTNESIKPIKKAFDKQNQFISDASHELKTPLAIISTNVDVLLSDPSDSKKWLYYIKSEVNRMGKLTENLLYLSQFDDHNLIDNNTDVNLSDLCQHVLLGIETLAFEKKRSLTYNIDSNIVVKGNYEHLSQVLLILVDNAIKYSDDNGYVNVNLSSNSHVCLEVSNSGPGITEASIDKIFNRFYKVDESRSQASGYGLGLAIAKSIINQHHGKISCKSHPNYKTIFTIKLPK